MAVDSSQPVKGFPAADRTCGRGGPGAATTHITHPVEPGNPGYGRWPVARRVRVLVVLTAGVGAVAAADHGEPALAQNIEADSIVLVAEIGADGDAERREAGEISEGAYRAQVAELSAQMADARALTDRSASAISASALLMPRNNRVCIPDSNRFSKYIRAMKLASPSRSSPVVVSWNTSSRSSSGQCSRRRLKSRIAL